MATVQAVTVPLEVSIQAACGEPQNHTVSAAIGGGSHAIVGGGHPYTPNQTFVASPTTPGLLGGGVQQNPPFTGFDQLNWPELPGSACGVEHTVKPDLIEWDGEHAIGFCEICQVKIRMPRIPGGVNWSRAGQTLGKALTVVDDDDIAEMLGDLNDLAAAVDKEVAALERARKMIKLARNMIGKKATAGV